MNWIDRHRKGCFILLILVCGGLLSYCSYQGREDLKEKKAKETVELLMEDGLVRENSESSQTKQEGEKGDLKASEIRKLVEDKPSVKEEERISVVESGLQFVEEEALEKLSWLPVEHREKLKEEIVNYLRQKELEGITTVRFLPDSTQTINDYEHYLYFAVDYETKYADRYVLQVRCDDYKEFPRYAVKMQYGD